MTANQPSTGRCFILWAALLALLLLNRCLAEVNLGAFNLAVALLIASGQMLLMVLYFMHVRYEKRLIWIFVSAGAIWLFIMFDLVLGDYLTRLGPIHQIFSNGF